MNGLGVIVVISCRIPLVTSIWLAFGWMGIFPATISNFSAQERGAVSAQQFGAKCDGLLPSGEFNARAHDDTAALQALFNFTAKRRERAVIPRNVQCNARHLIVPSYLSLVLDGILFQEAQANTDFLSTADGSSEVSNIVFDGKGTIDGNREQQAANKTDKPGACIGFKGVHNLLIGSIVVKRCAKFALNITDGSSEIVLRGTSFQDSGNSAEFANRCTNCWGYDVRVTNITDFGFAFYQGCFHCGLVGGYFDHNATGIGVLTDDAKLPMSYDITLTHVSASYNDGPGFYIWNNPNGGAPDGRQHHLVRISDWHGDHNNQDRNMHNASAYFGGVRLADCAFCSVTNGSEMDDGGNSSDISPCIFLAPGLSSPVVIGNICRNEGSGGGVGLGIAVSTETTLPVITDNVIEDSQSIPSTLFGLTGKILDGDKAIVANNRIKGNFRGRPDNIEYGPVRSSTQEIIK